MKELLDTVAEGGIRLGVSATDWREVVEVTGELMANLGLTEPRYTQAMIDNIVDNGPYLVIAPGLALLHARPEAGTIRPGLVVVTLADPVSFGHSTNDPVRVALGLSAVDAQSHVGALQAIATTLGQPGAIERLASLDPSDLKGLNK